MFETQKIRKQYKFRRSWSQHQTIFKSQLEQDQVSWGVSVLCWHATSVANVLWKPYYRSTQNHGLNIWNGIYIFNMCLPHGPYFFSRPFDFKVTFPSNPHFPICLKAWFYLLLVNLNINGLWWFAYYCWQVDTMYCDENNMQNKIKAGCNGIHNC